MKKAIIGIAFVFVIGLAFLTGRLTYQQADNIPQEITDQTVLEVMNDLLENHYSQPSKEQLLQGAIDGMIASLDDPHTSYFDADSYAQFQSSFGESYVGVGISVQFTDNVIVVHEVKAGGPADNAGILPNDVIASVDGSNTMDGDYYSAINKIIGEEGTDVTLGIIRSGVPDIINLTMTRAQINNSSVTFTTYTSGDTVIGYIKVNTFGDETAQKFHDAVLALDNDNISGLIVDLRDNGGGHLTTVVNMMNEFLVKSDKPMFSTEYFSDGEFNTHSYYATNTTEKPYNIVTLVNGNSASASEVFSSAMQENGLYTLVGTTTYGKGTMQTDFSIRSTESDLLHISIGKWITANENWVDQHGGSNGITPDVVVEQNAYETAYKMFLFDDETFSYNQVDTRIENMQNILHIMGYTIREDGYFDSATENAIKDIQTTNNLPVNGVADNAVMAVLNTALDTYQNNPDNDTQLEAAIQYLIEHPTHD